MKQGNPDAAGSPRRIALLGPQRDDPTVRPALERLGVAAGSPVAVVTAGWAEREPEDVELGEHLGAPVHNLNVYKRVDDVYQRDRELRDAMRARHDKLRALREVYQLRLGSALDAARELLARGGDPEVLDPERSDALEVVRSLDARHLRRVSEVLLAFEDRYQPRQREHVARHRREIAATLKDTTALCIAGGHVAILLNRMRVLDLLSLLGEQPIVAWSAGAMALAPTVVLFHDSPPQGPGDAEVFVPGMGLCPQIVPLPHARARLDLDDRARVALMAQRFRPAFCAALDPGAQLFWDGHRWSGVAGTQQLGSDGALEAVEAVEAA